MADVVQIVLNDPEPEQEKSRAIERRENGLKALVWFIAVSVLVAVTALFIISATDNGTVTAHRMVLDVLVVISGMGTLLAWLYFTMYLEIYVDLLGPDRDKHQQ